METINFTKSVFELQNGVWTLSIFGMKIDLPAAIQNDPNPDIDRNVASVYITLSDDTLYEVKFSKGIIVCECLEEASYTEDDNVEAVNEMKDARGKEDCSNQENIESVAADEATEENISDEESKSNGDSKTDISEDTLREYEIISSQESTSSKSDGIEGVNYETEITETKTCKTSENANSCGASEVLINSCKEKHEPKQRELKVRVDKPDDTAQDKIDKPVDKASNQALETRNSTDDCEKGIGKVPEKAKVQTGIEYSIHNDGGLTSSFPNVASSTNSLVQVDKSDQSDTLEQPFPAFMPTDANIQNCEQKQLLSEQYSKFNTSERKSSKSSTDQTYESSFKVCSNALQEFGDTTTHCEKSSNENNSDSHLHDCKCRSPEICSAVESNLSEAKDSAMEKMTKQYVPISDIATSKTDEISSLQECQREKLAQNLIPGAENYFSSSHVNLRLEKTESGCWRLDVKGTCVELPKSYNAGEDLVLQFAEDGRIVVTSRELYGENQVAEQKENMGTSFSGQNEEQDHSEDRDLLLLKNDPNASKTLLHSFDDETFDGYHVDTGIKSSIKCEATDQVCFSNLEDKIQDEICTENSIGSPRDSIDHLETEDTEVVGSFGSSGKFSSNAIHEKQPELTLTDQDGPRSKSHNDLDEDNTQYGDIELHQSDGSDMSISESAELKDGGNSKEVASLESIDKCSSGDVQFKQNEDLGSEDKKAETYTRPCNSTDVDVTQHVEKEPQQESLSIYNIPTGEKDVNVGLTSEAAGLGGTGKFSLHNIQEDRSEVSGSLDQITEACIDQSGVIGDEAEAQDPNDTTATAMSKNGTNGLQPHQVEKDSPFAEQKGQSNESIGSPERVDHKTVEQEIEAPPPSANTDPDVDDITNILQSLELGKNRTTDTEDAHPPDSQSCHNHETGLSEERLPRKDTDRLRAEQERPNTDVDKQAADAGSHERNIEQLADDVETPRKHTAKLINDAETQRNDTDQVDDAEAHGRDSTSMSDLSYPGGARPKQPPPVASNMSVHVVPETQGQRSAVTHVINETMRNTMADGGTARQGMGTGTAVQSKGEKLIKKISFCINYHHATEGHKSQKRTGNIRCTFEEHMKWKFVLQSDKRIDECNKYLESNPYKVWILSDWEVNVSDVICSDIVQEEIKEKIFECVMNVGRDLKIDTLTTDTEAEQWAITLNERGWNSGIDFYVEAMDSQTLSVAHSYSNIDEIIHFCQRTLQSEAETDQNQVRWYKSVSMGIGKMFLYKRWIDEIHAKLPDVKCTVSVNQHYILSFEGPAASIQKAQDIISQYETSIIIETYQAGEDVRQVLRELYVCDELEEEMKKLDIECFLEQRGMDLIMFCTEHEELQKTISHIRNAIICESISLIQQWQHAEKKNELMDLILNEVNRKKIAMSFGEEGHMFIAGFRSEVENAKMFVCDLFRRSLSQKKVMSEQMPSKTDVLMSPGIGRVFRHKRWIQVIRNEHPNVQITFSCGQKCVVELEGSDGCVKEAKAMVDYYKGTIIMKHYKPYEEIQKVLCDLSVCDELEGEMKKQNIDCFVEQDQNRLILYLTAEKDVTRAFSLVNKTLTSTYVLLMQQWRKPEKKKELEDLLLKKIDQDRAYFYMAEGEKVCIAGISSEVKRAQSFVEDIIHGRYQQPHSQETAHAAKVIVENFQYFTALKELNHPEGVCKRFKVQYEHFQMEGCQGFEFRGTYENVKGAEQEMRQIVKKLIDKSVYFDTDKEQKYLESDDCKMVLNRLEQENQVLIRLQQSSSNHATYEGTFVLGSQVGAPNKQQTWHFPGDHHLMLVQQNLDDCTADVIAKFLPERPDAYSKLAISSVNEQCMKVTLRIPYWVDGSRNEVLKFERCIKTLLTKVEEDEKDSVAICLTPVANWQRSLFVECLGSTVTEYFNACRGNCPPRLVVVCAESEDDFEKGVKDIHTCIDRLKLVSEPSRVVIEVKAAELSRVQADVLVNTTSADLDLKNGGVSAALLKQAGYEMQQECKQKYPTGLRHGQVAITGGHKLQCKMVIHGSLDRYRKEKAAESIMALRDFVSTCLSTAERDGCKSIAFPAIGAGNLAYPADIVASEMFGSVERFRLHGNPQSLEKVYFVIYNRDHAILKEFKDFEKQMDVRASKDATESKSISVAKVVITGVDENVNRTEALLKKALHDGKVMERKSEEVGQHLMQNQLISQKLSKLDFAAMKQMYKGAFDEFIQNGIVVTHLEEAINLYGRAESVSRAVWQLKEPLAKFRRLHKELITFTDLEKATAGPVIVEMTSMFKDILFVQDDTRAELAIYGSSGREVGSAKDILLNKLVTRRSEGQRNAENSSNNTKSAREFRGERSFSWSTHAKNMRTFQIKKTLVKVYEANIMHVPVDCIVNAANKNLVHDGGIAHQISIAAGSTLEEDCKLIISKRGSLPVGSVAMTTAGDMGYKGVIHAVGPCWFDFKPFCDASIKKCQKFLMDAVYNSLLAAHKQSFKSIALPAISVGALFGVPKEICAMQYAEAVNAFGNTGRHIEEIHFVDLDSSTVGLIQHVFHQMITEKKGPPFDTKKYIAVKNTARGPSDVNPGGANGGGGHVTAPIYFDQYGKVLCRFPPQQEVHIYTGNILSLPDPIEAIVCSEDTSGAGKGMVAKVLAQRGGRAYAQAKHTEFQKRHRPGDVVVTKGYSNVYWWIMHAVMSGPSSQATPEELQTIIVKILDIAVKKKFKSLVMSLLGTGSGGLDTDKCVKVLMDSYRMFHIKHQTAPLVLHVVNIEQRKTQLVQQVFKQYIDKQMPSLSAGKPSSPLQPIVSKSGKQAGQSNAGKNQAPQRLPPSSSASSSQPAKTQSGQSKPPESPPLPSTSSSPSSGTALPSRTASPAAATGGTSVADKPSAAWEDKAGDDCVICIDKLEDPKMLKCGHKFCTECIDQHLKVKQTCPVCGMVLGVITGNQPDGEMEIMYLKSSVAGYDGMGTIGISYTFKDGTQGPDHPRPGSFYAGVSRTGYLPDNEDGRKVCAMLKQAFKRRLVFTIGRSRTTGQEGVITWNDIHHKTDHRPNTQYGYPDPGYLDRVKDELGAKGVTEADIDQKFLKKLTPDGPYRIIIKTDKR